MYTSLALGDDKFIGVARCIYQSPIEIEPYLIGCKVTHGPVRFAVPALRYLSRGPSLIFPAAVPALYTVTQLKPQSYSFVCSLFYVSVCILRKIGRSWIFWNEGKRTRKVRHVARHAVEPTSAFSQARRFSMAAAGASLARILPRRVHARCQKSQAALCSDKIAHEIFLSSVEYCLWALLLMKIPNFLKFSALRWEIFPTRASPSNAPRAHFDRTRARKKE